ncbi:hypothetical protein, partial [Enterobacter sp. 56-7]|uniref:hypothetical protein n=1 Tax=Enterobacter sp. 56-7 TaxID=1895906 RepID=UPI00257D283B
MDWHGTSKQTPSSPGMPDFEQKDGAETDAAAMSDALSRRNSRNDSRWIAEKGTSVNMLAGDASEPGAPLPMFTRARSAEKTKEHTAIEMQALGRSELVNINPLLNRQKDVQDVSGAGEQQPADAEAVNKVRSRLEALGLFKDDRLDDILAEEEAQAELKKQQEEREERARKKHKKAKSSSKAAKS